MITKLLAFLSIEQLLKLILAIAKVIAKKTENKKDDYIVQMIEDVLKEFRNLVNGN